MPFDPKFPDPWIFEQAGDDPALRPLCLSVYYEDALIRFPKCAVLIWPGCTINAYDRPGQPDDPRERLEWVRIWAGDLVGWRKPRLRQMMEEAGIEEDPPTPTRRD